MLRIEAQGCISEGSLFLELDAETDCASSVKSSLRNKSEACCHVAGTGRRGETSCENASQRSVLHQSVSL